MRALSLWQPWAHAVVHLGKRIENRTAWTGCSFRGPFLIHASKGVGTRDDFDDAVETIIDVVRPAPGTERATMVHKFADMQIGGRGYHHAEGHWVPSPDLPRGGIIGAAYLEGVVTNEEDFARYVEEKGAQAEQQRAWWFGGFALVLSGVISLPFRPWKGKQGWFDVPADPVMGTGGRLRGVAWRDAA
jgi:hypothetical protein